MCFAMNVGTLFLRLSVYILSIKNIPTVRQGINTWQV